MDHLPMPKFGPLAGLRVVFSGIEIAGPFAGQSESPFFAP